MYTIHSDPDDDAEAGKDKGSPCPEADRQAGKVSEECKDPYREQDEYRVCSRFCKAEGSKLEAHILEGCAAALLGRRDRIISSILFSRRFSKLK